MNSKHFLLSKGFWGIALGTILYVAHTLFGVTPDAANDTAIEITNVLLLLLGAYGRIVASRPLRFTTKDD